MKIKVLHILEHRSVFSKYTSGYYNSTHNLNRVAVISQSLCPCESPLVPIYYN